MLFIVIFLMLTLSAFGFDALAGRLASAWRGWRNYAMLLALLICAVTFLDLYTESKNSFFRYSVNWREFFQTKQPWDPLAEKQGEFRTFRLMVQDMPFYGQMDARAVAGRFQRLQPNLNMLYGLSLVGGYEEGLIPLVRFKDFMLTYNRNFRSARPDTQLLALMNVRYVYSELPVQSDRLKRMSIPPYWQQRLPYSIYENADWRGGVFWLHDIQTHYDLSLLDGTYSRNGKLMTHYGSEFQTYSKQERPSHAIRKSEQLSLSRKSINELHIEKPAGAEAEICLSMASYPGWVAIDSNERTPLNPLNAIHSSFLPSADSTKLIVRYEPFSFRLGLFLTLMVLLFILASFIFLV
jgi:hypothetical protein